MVLRKVHLTEEVRYALEEGVPVVALESTIISHGMPWPGNYEAAVAVEEVVRQHGAVPATIALIGGKIRAGLEKEQIEYLARAGRRVEKVSRYNFAHVLARNADGATTVAATMWVASMAGIRVFATGGIGGVHRGWAHTLDISADLEALARTRVAVVSAGAKAILDLPATLEYLETRGVPVIGVGTDTFPAFFSRSSGLKLAMYSEDVAEIAGWVHTHWSLPDTGGVLVANPVPRERALEWAVAQAAIEQALKEADAKDVRGKELTPFLLQRIVELTGGKSLEANIALVKHNAALAARLAGELALCLPDKG